MFWCKSGPRVAAFMTAGVGCGAVLWNAWPWSQLVTGETRSGREPKLTQELQNASTGSGPAEGG